MNEFVLDKRNHLHCPKCNSDKLYFKLSPVPINGSLRYKCSECENEIEAKRIDDHHEFNGMATVFNQ